MRCLVVGYYGGFWVLKFGFLWKRDVVIVGVVFSVILMVLVLCRGVLVLVFFFGLMCFFYFVIR